jgi:uncharacterized protein with PQ loop repeat
MSSDIWIEIAGWIPAVVFPSATGLQLAKIIKHKSAKGVSIATWLLFGLSNLGLYAYAEKYTSIQTIAGFLGTALLDFIIAAMAFYKKGH